MLREGDEFEAQLWEASRTRPIIEQAKGVLATLRGSPPEQAFSELRWASMQHNVKLQALADALVNAVTGRSPADPRLTAILHAEWAHLHPRLRHPSDGAF